MKVQNLLIKIFLINILVINISRAQEPTELISSRKPNQKLFLNPDQSFTARIYNKPIHYLGENGKYLEINPEIEPSTLPGYSYEVCKGIYQVYFKNNPMESNSVLIKLHSSYTFGFRLVGAGYYESSSQNYHLFSNIQPGQLTIAENTITHKDLLPGLEINLHYETNCLKEELIIRQRARNIMPNPSQFGFNADSTFVGFVMEIKPDPRLLTYINDSTQIQLNNFQSFSKIGFKTIKKSLKFLLPIDYAFLITTGVDSLAFSNSLIKLKRRILSRNGKIYLIAGVPYSWMTSQVQGDIVIDPTIVVKEQATDDTWLEDYSPKGTNNLLIVGKAAYYPKKRTTLKFPISNIPDDATIESSYLKVFYYGKGKASWSTETFIPRYIRANIIFTNWSESSADAYYPWKSTPYGSFGTEPGSSDYYSDEEDEILFDINSGCWKEFNLIRAVNAWRDGYLGTLEGIQNFGVVLWATNEDEDGYDLRMRSSEYSDINYKPYLEITYRKQLYTFYYLKDHLGSVRVTVDAEGVMVGYDDYYPFGQQIPGRSGNSGNPDDVFKFTSKELDEPTDLYYFGARYYDPALGRWLSVDPMAEIYSSLSPYNYSANNPLVFIDPTGQSWFYYHAAGDSTAQWHWHEGNKIKTINQHKKIRWLYSIIEEKPKMRGGDPFAPNGGVGNYMAMADYIEKNISHSAYLAWDKTYGDLTLARDIAWYTSMGVAFGTAAGAAGTFAPEIQALADPVLTGINDLTTTLYVWGSTYGTYYVSMLLNKILDAGYRTSNYYLMNKPAIDNTARSVGTFSSRAPSNALGPTDKDIDNFLIMLRVYLGIKNSMGF